METTFYQQRFGTPEEFIEALRAKLALHNVSHAKLALAAGVCPTQLSRWMNKRVRPSLESMIRLDAALNTVLYGDATNG